MPLCRTMLAPSLTRAALDSGCMYRGLTTKRDRSPHGIDKACLADKSELPLLGGGVHRTPEQERAWPPSFFCRSSPAMGGTCRRRSVTPPLLSAFWDATGAQRQRACGRVAQRTLPRPCCGGRSSRMEGVRNRAPTWATPWIPLYPFSVSGFIPAYSILWSNCPITNHTKADLAQP
eukprot:XP_001704589.1 Hypothetical protein GL50803_7632 [Giardia lamblia ATCC 50803]